MKNSRLLEIMPTLTRSDKRSLRLWLDANIHNRREDVRRLYDYLVQHYNDSLEDKKAVWKAVFPEQPYQDAILRQTLHFLLESVEDWLVYQAVQKERDRRQLYLIKALRQRHCYDSAAYYLHEMRPLPPIHRQERYEWELEELGLRQNKKGREQSPNLTEITTALDTRYAAEKLRLQCSKLSHKIIQSIDYNDVIWDTVLEYIHQSDLLQIPSIRLYYHCFCALSGEPDADSHFNSLTEGLTKVTQTDDVSIHELRELYLFGINYAIRKVNTGSKDFLRKAFELYQKGIERQALMEDGQLSVWTFRNIVGAGLHLREYTWTEQFIERYYSFLEEKHQQDLLSESRAKLAYEQGNKEKAMQLLASIEFKDALHQLTCKTFLAKIYYEVQELDILESLLSSMEIFVRRHRLIGYHKDVYKNIIRLMRQLLRLPMQDKTSRASFRQLVLATKPLSEQTWFLKQIE